MAETEEQRVERLAKESRQKRSDPFYGGRYPAAAQESERAGGAGITIPGLGMRARLPFSGKDMLQVALPTAGEIAGAATPIPGGAFMGGAAGGALANRLTGENPAVGAATGALGVAAGRVLEPVGQFLGKKAAGPIRSGLERMIPSVFARDVGAEKALEMLATKGESLTLGQASQNRWIANIEAATEGLAVGGGGLAKAQKRASTAGRELADEFVKLYPTDMTDVEVGQTIQTIMDDTNQAFRLAAKSRYKPIDDAVAAAGQSAAIPTAPWKDASTRFMKDQEGIVSDKTRQIVKQVMALDDTMSFERAANLRSIMVGIKGSAEESIPYQSAKLGKVMRDAVDTDMERTAANLDPALVPKWRDAQQFYKRGIRMFDDDLLVSMMQKKPEDVAQFLVTSRGKVKKDLIQRLQDITNTYATTGSTEDLMDPLRGAVINSLTKRGSKGQGVYGANSVTELDGKKLREALYEFGGSYDGGDALQRVFGKQGAQNFADIARTLELSQRRATRKFATFGLPSVTLLQAGAGLAVWKSDELSPGQKTAALGTIFYLGPRAVSWVLKDKEIVSLILKGQEAAPGSLLSTKIGGQIMSRMAAAQRMFGGDQVRVENGKVISRPLSLSQPERRQTTFEETRP